MPLKDFDDGLIKRLEDPQYAVAYLRAALEDEDAGTFFLVLNKLARARGGMTRSSEDSSLNRAGVYRSLSENGNPSFKTIKNCSPGSEFSYRSPPLTPKPRCNSGMA